MRCPDCMKFVGLETEEPEENDVSVVNNDDGTATVTASATINRNCDQCSTTLKSAEFEIEDLVTLTSVTEGDEIAHASHVLSFDNAEWETVEDSTPKPKEVKSRKTGKMEMRYPNSRYVRSLFGVKLTGIVTCDECDDAPGGAVDFESVSSMIGAGEFEEQV